MGKGKEAECPPPPGPSPPPYCEHDDGPPDAPPDCNQALSEQGVHTSTRYPIFPSVMNLHGSRLRWLSADLCGTTARERLFHVDFHTGLSATGPLGARPGIVLRSGPSGKASILGAGGWTSASAATTRDPSPDSVILLPSLDPDGGADLVEETMRGATTPAKDVLFRFNVETGEKWIREEFVWELLDAGSGGDSKRRRFRLSRAGTRAPAGGKGGSSSKAEDSTVAMLRFNPTAHSLHYLQLELLGIGRTGYLGQRWTLMTVLMALRLWMLRVNLQAGAGGASAGEKAHGLKS
ncbi:Delta 8-(E)-sphingolipid desaturase [Purpureocillium lavendulum]|uniref:Delta 8-(E)-sphingolipid desaturase n=1 Tax=Purpureocillium lavendulum TaxID=1247861 RepID=A0AB34FQY5_9HYPO|nr:Delta 8-(E)-sphingolipid desaturase [Purpureocillium lavendulum]